MKTGGAQARARAAWGSAMPGWLASLADACDASSVRKIAERLKVSPALISRVINGHYKASLDFLAGRVREALLTENVACPALGEISAATCHEEQRKPFVSANPLAVAVYRACRNGCPHFNAKLSHGQKQGARPRSCPEAPGRMVRAAN